MSASPHDGLSQDELELLQHDQIILPGPITGKRKISAAFLSPPSSAPSSVSSSSSQSSASIRFHHATIPNGSHFDMPISSISVEALEYIGFTEARATDIYNRWIDRPDSQINPDDLIDYACGHILMLNLPAYDNMDPNLAMEAVGLTAELQISLLDPQFSGLFWSNTLHYWVLDTITLRYASLRSLQDRLKAYVKQCGGKKKKRVSLEGVFPPVPSTDEQQTTHPSDTTATLTMMTDTHHFAANHVSIVTEPPAAMLPDHITLYKGKSAAEMYSREPWIREDGSLNMRVMRSAPGGDFNHDLPAHYWTYEKDVAEQYRQWAVRRVPQSESWLISVQVSNTFLTGLNQQDLWFSPEWKGYVWYCKRQSTPPATFDYLWKQPFGADLIRGHICTGVNRSITSLTADQVQTGISGDNVMIGGSSNRKATQLVFSNACADNLGEEIRTKVHIEVFPRDDERK